MAFPLLHELLATVGGTRSDHIMIVFAALAILPATTASASLRRVYIYAKSKHEHYIPRGDESLTPGQNAQILMACQQVAYRFQSNTKSANLLISVKTGHLRILVPPI